MSLMYGLTRDRDTDEELHRIADYLAGTFGHSREIAEDLVRDFYLAVTRPDGSLRNVMRWTDDDFWHEDVGTAFYVQYHMTQPGYRTFKTLKFLDWRTACAQAQKAGEPMPAVPEPDTA